jgi:hypothetical protein
MRLAIVSLILLVGVGCKSSAKREVLPPTSSSMASPDRQIQEMALFEVNGYTLSGAEYWPYAGTEDIKYPEEVLWGFYPKQGEVPPGETDKNPASASAQAIACATTAYAKLQQFLAQPPAKLQRIIELGTISGDVVPRFYLWTNDYLRAATPYPPGMREARLWFWKRKQPEPPKPPGYWKWESVLTQRGECLVPQPAQIEAYLTTMLDEMERAHSTTKR